MRGVHVVSLLVALVLLVMFVRESGYTVRQTVVVKRNEIISYVRLAARLAPRAAGE